MNKHLFSFRQTIRYNEINGAHDDLEHALDTRDREILGAGILQGGDVQPCDKPKPGLLRLFPSVVWDNCGRRIAIQHRFADRVDAVIPLAALREEGIGDIPDGKGSLIFLAKAARGDLPLPFSLPGKTATMAMGTDATHTYVIKDVFQTTLGGLVPKQPALVIAEDLPQQGYAPGSPPAGTPWTVTVHDDEPIHVDLIALAGRGKDVLPKGQHRMVTLVARFARDYLDYRLDGHGVSVPHRALDHFTLAVELGAPAAPGKAIAPALPKEGVLLADVCLRHGHNVTAKDIDTSRQTRLHSLSALQPDYTGQLVHLAVFGGGKIYWNGKVLRFPDTLFLQNPMSKNMHLIKACTLSIADNHAAWALIPKSESDFRELVPLVLPVGQTPKHKPNQIPWRFAVRHGDTLNSPQLGYFGPKQTKPLGRGGIDLETLARIKKEFARVDKDRDTLQQAMTKADEQQQSLRKRLETADSDRQTIQRSLNNTEKNQQVIQKRLGKADKDRRTIQQHLDDADKKQQIMQRSLKSAKENQQAMQQDLKNADSEQQKMQQRVAISEACQQEIQSVQQKHTEFCRLLEQATKSIQSKQDKYNKQIQRLEEETQKFQRRNNTLQAVLTMPNSSLSWTKEKLPSNMKFNALAGANHALGGPPGFALLLIGTNIIQRNYGSDCRKPDDWLTFPTKLKHSLHAMCCGEDGSNWLGVGDKGYVVSSYNIPDHSVGTHWHHGNTGVKYALRACTFGRLYGKYFYSAVGDKGTIVTKTYAGPWTQCKSGTSKNLYAVATNGKQIVVAGEDNTLLASTDGVVWKPIHLSCATYSQYLRHYCISPAQLTWNATCKKFLLAGKNVLLSSADGYSWSSNFKYNDHVGPVVAIDSDFLLGFTHHNKRHALSISYDKGYTCRYFPISNMPYVLDCKSALFYMEKLGCLYLLRNYTKTGKSELWRSNPLH